MKQREAIKKLGEAGLLGPDVILVHDTNIVDDDSDLLAKTKTEVSLSPFTELRTGFGITPVGALTKAGVPLSLSVDTTVLCRQLRHVRDHEGDPEHRRRRGAKRIPDDGARAFSSWRRPAARGRWASPTASAR